ncbi:MAG TPA: DUF202 domain-containing protein [Candidatus Acidoferrales bacterium]|nr:DUF202 domain-containing protein [Candidatus Acidoferrales bacterium]
MDTRNRDYFANERTFLAYLRTALSFVAFGFVVARFSLFAREFSIVAHEHVPSTNLSTVFGVVMVGAGVVVALYGTLRYARAHAAIVADRPAPMPPRAAVVLGAVMALIGLAVAAVLLAYR